ncbi:transcriptional regulator [Vibrio sp. 10N.286.49.C2]|uniref:LysR family transcriptional regulator n=1 Tax=unclassified Vibrio TaxID=2614977 RepID=UPI000C82FD12|nr:MULTISPECIES: LysR family transcriptional regulator [unclassified Vibrio]PMH29535.1 transcriptional regulator [Vibrio sp. 10N.286.49.C2]PMH56050.1 transcriptional regulator [Vibrio sp. 10N.286.49.B1]PMH77689.1 transcriptional regulator [Vibrio sp. 10N.286.48.B7]
MLLEGIDTLLVLSQEKTMSRTGSRLYIGQSAVSKRIANLEKRLGKKLIEPDGRQIKLTPDALALIERIGSSVNELKGLISEEQTLSDQTLIRLDCSETLVAGYLSEFIVPLLNQDPYLTITTNHTPRIIEHVSSGDAMIGLCAGHLSAKLGLQATHLFDEPFKIVSQTPLIHAPRTLITNDLNNPANTYQAALLQQSKIEPAMQMDSYTAAAQLAIKGAGAALVPMSIIKTLHIDEALCFDFDFLSALTRPIHVIYRSSTLKIHRAKTVIETIEDAVPRVALSPSPLT